MSRVKISEFRAKAILSNAFGQVDYAQEVRLSDLNICELSGAESLVVKVDQAEKKRNTKGLVRVGRSSQEALCDLKEFQGAGYSFALVEPLIEHDRSDEKYVALRLSQDGVEIMYSDSGGVDVEKSPETIKSGLINEKTIKAGFGGLSSKIVETLYEVFQTCHMTYLEINPFVMKDGQMHVLDAAVEVDSAAEHFVNGLWTESDIRTPKRTVNAEEARVDYLSSKTPASLTLRVLNKDGSVGLLLSGGGVSVAIADEFSAKGRHDDMINYGEYSGNPSEDDTYYYTKEVLSLVLASKSKNKVLLIAGGVANFTDVAVTFKGIARAINDVAQELKENKVAVFVRRGGPNQQKGLRFMEDTLNTIGLKNAVFGPDMNLSGIVDQVSKEFV